jgi:antitoxin component of MazEF toxin-antitoxin module
VPVGEIPTDELDGNRAFNYNIIIMIQKVLKVGTSAAVTIPKKSLKELGIKPGDDIVVELDTKNRSVLIRPSNTSSKHQQKITERTLDFIDRYRVDLENLAKK